jgi:5'(3')-deoxyribonucleotidase
MKTIAVDVDDVLAQSAKGLTAFSNQTWGTTLTPSDYDEHWANMWGVDIEEVKRRTQIFYDSKIVQTYLPMQGAVEVLHKLKSRFNLVILTSRGSAIREDTEDWVEKYYKGIFSEVHLSGIWDDIALHKYEVTKTDICKQIGAEYLIDDQLKHCISANGAGISSILYGDYSWNDMNDLPNGIFRAHSWNQIEEYFETR